MPTIQTHDSIARINFRLPVAVKETVERAAVASGLSITDFAINALVHSANEVLERQHMRLLSDRDRDIFLTLLDSDEEPSEALKAAFAAHKELIAE